MPTLAPPNPDTDKNPGQKHQDELAQMFDESGNLRTLNEGTASKEGAINQARERLKNPEESAAAPKANSGLADIRKGEQGGGWQTNVKQKALGGVGGKLLTPKKIAQRWAIGGAIGLVMSLVTAAGSLTLIAFPNFSELANDRSHGINRKALSARQAVQKQTRYFSNPDDCRGVKVKCRFHLGLSDNEIKKLSNAGLKPDVGVGANGKKYIKSFTVNDINGNPISVNRGNWMAELSRNPNLHIALQNATAKPTMLKTAGIGAMNMIRKFKLNMTDPLGDPKTQQEAERNFRKYNYGERTEVDIKKFSDNSDQQNAIKEESEKYIPQGEGDAKWDQPIPPTPDLTNIDISEAHAKEVVQSALGGGLKGAIIGLAAVPDKICSAYDLVRKTFVLAKIYRYAGLIAYAGLFLTIMSKVKAGDASAQEIGFMMSIALAGSVVGDSVGKNFFHSEGWFFLSQGKIRNPGALAAATNGGSFYGHLKTANDTLQTVARSVGINLKRDCGAIKSTWGQVILGVVGVVINIGSLGSTSIIGLVGNAALGVTISVIEQYAIPTLAGYAAGMVAPDPKDPQGGYGAGTKFASGVMAIGSETAKRSGAPPLKKSDYARVAAEATEYNNKIAAWERRGKNPFDPNDPYSLTSKVIMAIVPYTSSLQYSLQQGAVAALSPFSMFQSATLPSFMASPALAQTADPYGSQYCEDEDIVEMGLATDAFCNILYAEDSNRLASTQYSPDEVNNYMVDNSHVDPTSGRPLSPEYRNFLADCVEDETPLLADGGGTSVEDNTNSAGAVINTAQCRDDNEKYHMFRTYLLDTVIFTGDHQGADGTFGKETTIPG